MTTESTTGGSTPAGSDPSASGDGPTDPAADGTVEASGGAAKSKVTRARATTSGAAPKGRPKAATSAAAAAAKRATKASAGTAVGPGRVVAVVPEPDAPDPTDVVRADRVEITQGGAGSVEATSISVTQGGIGSADARTIDVRQGGIGRASATDIAVSAGSMGFARGERVSIEMGAIGAAVGDEIRVTQSMAGFVAAQGDATVDQSLVSTLIADRVTIRQPSAVLVLIARQVDGTVRPLLDWRGALAAGAVAGLVIGLLRRVRC